MQIISALMICIFFLIPFTGLYVSLGGLWGVLWTDLFQFVLKMAIVIAVAYYAVAAVGGMGVLLAKLRAARSATPGSGDATSFFPDFSRGLTVEALWTIPAITFLVTIGLQWWAFWYPGAEPGGGGYIAQRIFSARDERNGLLSVLWFNIAHYAVRPWPWILAALACIVLYPNLQHPESGYMMIVTQHMPHALRGIVVAGFMAAFMSTVATQLNWGASYLVADFYRRFIRRESSERHYVHMSRLATVILVIASCYVSAQLASIRSGWEFVLELGAGTGGVYLLRWYWWRINAWSEISAMIGAFAVTVYLHPEWLPAALRAGIPDGLRVTISGSDSVVFATTALITAGITTLVWIAATVLTRPEADGKLLAFYRRVRPSALGWKRIARQAPEVTPVRDLGANTLDWILGCALVYGALFGIGKLVLEQWVAGAGLCAIAALSGALIYWHRSRRGWETLSGRTAGAGSEA